MTVGPDAELIDGWLAPDRAALLRLYAAGDISWHEFATSRIRGVRGRAGGLGALGLRPPMAGPDGPNAEARARGRARLRQVLHDLT